MGASPVPKPRFAPAAVRIERRDDGCILLRSTVADRTFLAERANADTWRELTYGEAHDSVRRIAQFLLDQGLDASQPVAILSENSIDHALLSLASMHVGVPVVPISPAYSLMTKDYGKLKHVLELIRPGLLFAADGARFAPAIRAVSIGDAKIVLGAQPPDDLPSIPFARLLEMSPRSDVGKAFRRSWTRYDRQDLVHLGLHRHAQRKCSTPSACSARISRRLHRCGASWRIGHLCSLIGYPGTTASGAVLVSEPCSETGGRSTSTAVDPYPASSRHR